MFWIAFHPTLHSLKFISLKLLYTTFSSDSLLNCNYFSYFLFYSYFRLSSCTLLVCYPHILLLTHTYSSLSLPKWLESQRTWRGHNYIAAALLLQEPRPQYFSRSWLSWSEESPLLLKLEFIVVFGSFVDLSF